MKRNPTLPPNFMLGYAIAAPDPENYGSQGRRGLYTNILLKKIRNCPLAIDILNYLKVKG